MKEEMGGGGGGEIAKISSIPQLFYSNRYIADLKKKSELFHSFFSE